MEKYVVFGPIIIFFAFFGLLILGFFFLVMKVIRKGLADEWVGTVIDKTSFEKREMGNSKKINHFHTVVFKTDKGEERKVPVTKENLDRWQLGDRAEKKKGERWPEKI